MYQTVIILDFGKGGQSVARRVRGHGVYCEVLAGGASIERIKSFSPVGIITADAPCFKAGDSDNIEKIAQSGIPLLAVSSGDGAGRNADTLREFLHNTCGCAGDWGMKAYAADAIHSIREKVGGGRVLCALSGGVDSSVAAALVHKAVGKQLICIFVDHGLMRKNEGDEVQAVFKNEFDMDFVRVDARDRFLSRLAGICAPEQKRRVIGKEFIRVFEEEAKRAGHADFLVQGTIYPDVIESGEKDEAVVKSHHNVGGLPEHMDFKEIIEPLRHLFKDEVKELGIVLGLPETLVQRQPFPGPGLSVRIIGEVTPDRLSILREADAIVREEIMGKGLHTDIQQYFAVLTDMRSVGVTGDLRTYDYTVAVRCVTTSDFMTADWARVPFDVLENISRRITSEVSHVNRVVYDITAKPPSTIEWE